MRIAVISDLHLGRRDAIDHFGHEDSAFLKFLRFLEANFERIVLLGDIYETLTARGLRSQRAELAAARAAHPELVRRFAQAPYHFVHGNHDLVTGEAEGAPDRLVLQADGVRMLFTHGHHHDWIIRHARWVSESCVWGAAWVRRLGLHAFFRALHRFDEFRSGARPDPSRCSFQRWAVAQAHAPQADVVVTGHTHLGLRVEHGDRLFLNSGTCSEGQFSFLSLDTAAGEYALHSHW